MSIEISHETEVLLTEEARKQGVSVDALVKRFIDQHRTTGHRDELPQPGSKKAQDFVAWAKGHRQTKPLSDEAVQRTSFYPDRS
jgi:hypothetical protein